jgi:hypothetical protein
VEARNYLGIYLSKDRATVVCIGSGHGNVLGCFSVSTEEQQEQNQQQALAALIAKVCDERKLKFSEVAVALDCAMFMQHNMHSEFNNPKQIAATVRFDTEEALTTDISDVAIAFQINSSDEGGSDLTVFTAKQKILSDILLSLQGNDIDPVTIEPDVNSLSRFICQKIPLLKSHDGATLFGLLSSRRGYFVTCRKPQKVSTLRTFLIGPSQDRNELLTRQVLITTNLSETSEAINFLKVFDSTNSVSHSAIDGLGIESEDISLAESAGIEPQALADCADPVDFAIAYGTALAYLEKAQNINFRNDFMPYQGKKLRIQKALKFLSISVTVLLVALGLYFQAQSLKINRYRASLADKFKPQYLAVMPGGKKLPDKFSEAVRKLGSELRRIRDVRSGLVSIKGEESVASKLTSVLEAFNKCAAQTDLNIDSVSITTKSISITGDTSNVTSTQKLREALIEKKLGNLQERISPTKSGRNSFSITIVPEK